MSGPDPSHTLDGQDGLEGAESGGDDGPTYNPRTDTYVGTFETASASVAVIQTLAAIKHCEPIELAPLYESVDPDALDKLVESATDELRVTMYVDDFEIVVTGDRRLEITPP